jgi:hypothetical protein
MSHLMHMVLRAVSFSCRTAVRSSFLTCFNGENGCESSGSHGGGKHVCNLTVFWNIAPSRMHFLKKYQHSVVSNCMIFTSNFRTICELECITFTCLSETSFSYHLRSVSELISETTNLQKFARPHWKEDWSAHRKISCLHKTHKTSGVKDWTQNLLPLACVRNYKYK